MNENVGGLDRLARSIVGPTLLIAGYTRFGGHHGRPLGLFCMMAGTALIETAISKVCPLNKALGLNTRVADSHFPESQNTTEAALALQELPGGAEVEEVRIEGGPNQQTPSTH